MCSIFPRRGQLSLPLGIVIRRSSCTTMSSATGSISTRCSHRSVHVLPLQPDTKSEFLLACSRCHQRNTSSFDIVENRCQCHRANESTDRCHEWNPCMLTTRVKDGWNNCLNEADELTLKRWRSREVALVFGVIVFVARSNKSPV
jgi:hypothetical protein